MQPKLGSDNGYPILNQTREIPKPAAENRNPADISPVRPPVKRKKAWYKRRTAVICLSVVILILVFGAGWFGGKYYQTDHGPKLTTATFQNIDGNSTNGPITCSSTTCSGGGGAVCTSGTGCASQSDLNAVSGGGSDSSSSTCVSNQCTLSP